MHHVDLGTIHLISGPGKGDELCVMQWVARFAGEPVSDHPVCTSPVLTAFAIAWNDALPDDTRQRLVPFIPRLVGTAGDPEADEVRAWMAADWLVRVFAAAWLRKAGMAARADALASLPAITSSELARSAQPIIDGARKKAAVARDAARDAAWAVARDAARDAAWAVAWAAARDAARDAAWAAARAVARDAAWDAAWAAARAAARDAAWAAAWDAAWAAAWDAAKGKKGYSDRYDAAYKAARPLLDEAFRETTAELNESAFELLDRMIEVRGTGRAASATSSPQAPARPAAVPDDPYGSTMVEGDLGPQTADECPIHHKPWKESARDKFCSGKMPDGSWCKERP